PSSQTYLDQFRKSKGINATGPLTPADYNAMGYDNRGYMPYDNTMLNEIVINTNANNRPTISGMPVNVTSDNRPADENNPNRFNIDSNRLLRYAPALGNALQLNSLQE